MPDSKQPPMDDEPPSYTQATGLRPPNPTHRPSTRNGIPPEHRRSMEDEARPLPHGWARQYDAVRKHQFFVDTTHDPPRSIWHHPLDDPQFLASLSSEQRERLEEADRRHMEHASALFHGDSSDDDEVNEKRHDSYGGTASKGAGSSGDASGKGKGKKPLGQSLKDKLTGTTHEQRVQERQLRAEEERKAYEAHRRFRDAMSTAYTTGQPALVGKDREGRDVYVEPPGGARAPPGAALNYNPYAQGPYTNPNARFINPAGPYGRPAGPGYGGGYYGGNYGRYGGGYGGYGYGGGGYGLPIAGGLLGGVLLGGLLF